MNKTNNNTLNLVPAIDKNMAAEFRATTWLMRQVEVDNEENECFWHDWLDAEGILDFYRPDLKAFGLISATPERPWIAYKEIEIGPRGTQALEACVEGADPELVIWQWQMEILLSGSIEA
ncbi:hypothetical protein [Aliiruegeria sabulilitoris]|uniref:hypothetical protein n=1 Tax=Aliiruegeria sabulilitoris TaxID=1510458 RepID=UPI00082B0AC9|nr:hypothetical protein [Aliiruegeria sabulilitoris]NDR56309.1 hypothetical protein [Pseudoruegeria sp. M32A2M]